jgi:hypothetical protein
MLAEIFLMRLETMVQEGIRNGTVTTGSNTRFVPVQIPGPGADKAAPLPNGGSPR